MKTKLQVFFILTILSSTLILAQTQKAKYSITFNSVWNSTDHGTLPSNAHWSRLVGATHKTSGTFLKMNENATTGIKNIAESGSNSVFSSEVSSAISNNEADQYINGNSLSAATGSVIINNLIVDKKYPLLTLVSMIAPSPDWIIAINGAELLDASNNWKSSITIDLFPYDAGTDSGTNYTSGNSTTSPAGNIISLKNTSPFNDKKIGTLTISLEETLSVDVINLKNDIRVYYNSRGKNISFLNTNSIKVSKIEIYTILGKKVKKEVLSENSISVENITNGIYIVKVFTNKGVVSRKIVKH